jgi:uncharacterized alpha-E superfamily protein
VLRDLTDAPGGDGYALLARAVLARLYPDAIGRLGVPTHDGFLRALRGALAALAPADRPNPRTVVLHGGPDEPGHVEHASLATRLGLNAVEAGDLTVHDGRVWLRALDGLEPVDVVLRRLPELRLDPLEDDTRGAPGVAGLLDAARAGRVGLANGPAAALAAFQPLHSFVGPVCRALLGEDPLLPPLPTLWLGDPAMRAEVLARLPELVLFDADPRSISSAFGDELDDEGEQAWRALATAAPQRLVAQPKVAFATTPALVEGEIRPVTAVLRLVAAAGPDGITVMPGGHARVIDPSIPVTRQMSGVGKDVWVLDAPADRTSGRAVAVPQIDLAASVPTRAAEAMFWMGRNAERAEMVARTVSMVLARRAREPDLDPAGQAELAGALRAVSAAGDGVAAHDLLDDVMAALAGRPGTLLDAVGHLLSGARSVRDFLSLATWRVLALLDLERARTDGLVAKGRAVEELDLGEALDHLVVPLAALAGLGAESQVHGPAWRFLDLGRRLERSLLTLNLLDALLGRPRGAASRAAPPEALDDGAASAGMELALACCESLVAYRRRFRTEPALDAVGELLLADASNPRAVRFQLDRLAEHLAALPDRPVRHAQEAGVAAALDALAVQLPLPAAEEAGPASVTALVLAVRAELLAVSEAFASGWFTATGRWRRS